MELDKLRETEVLLGILTLNILKKQDIGVLLPYIMIIMNYQKFIVKQ